MQLYEKIYNAVICLLYIMTTKKDVLLLQTYWAMQICVYISIVKSTLNQKLQLEKPREVAKSCRYILLRSKEWKEYKLQERI